MGTIVFVCGCSISHSMFGNREIISVHPCVHHIMNKDVQVLLEDLRKLVVKLQDDDPWKPGEYNVKMQA